MEQKSICTHTGCERVAKDYHKLCRMHRERKYKGQDMNAPQQKPGKKPGAGSRSLKPAFKPINAGQLCSQPLCKTRAHTHGLCLAHDKRQRLGQDMDKPIGDRKQRPQDGLCTLEVCNRAYYVAGLCRQHWNEKKLKAAKV